MQSSPILSTEHGNEGGRVNVHDIVIIGAGPAGISMAVEARAAGIASEKVVVLEKASEHSFTLKKFYPDNKLVTANYKGFDAVCTGVMCLIDSSKHETISYLDKAISDHNIRVHHSETVTKIAKQEEKQLFIIATDKNEYEGKVVVIAIGILGKPNKPEYRIPPTLRKKLLFDVTTTEMKDSHVLVVGGGDSASEYCQYLIQRNNRVVLSYRRGEFTRMNDINRESVLVLAQRGELEIQYNSTITLIKDAGGTPEVQYAEPEYGSRTFDYVVYALGGTTPHNFLKTIGIEFDGDAPYLKEGYETNVPGMFLVGDLSAGTKGGSIIWAFNSANAAMKRIVRNYIGSLPP
jgi:thioredoxin reductase (NADPH)